MIPYLRVPDQAGLGNESGFSPPVGLNTPSNASLRFGYVQTDGFYGSTTPIARFDHQLYLMDRPTGRLVETPADITAMISAYSGAYDPVTGDVTKPTSALVTGYDFLTDTAQFIAKEWGTDGKLTVDQSLISSTWTAAQLEAKLLGATKPTYGLVNLNGHFSANTGLAGDFATRFKTQDFAPIADGRFINMLILSSGCHSGYNIVDDQIVPNVTQPLDWPQLFNGKGATLIGGTGYQYGDTDFRKYTELILSNFSQELRYGTGPVAVGDALASAKLTYLSQVASLSGTDEKALVESTLYGLPMFTVDLPAAGRHGRPPSSGISAPAAGTSNGLSVASVTPSYVLNPVSKSLTTATGSQVASYYDATYGSIVNDVQTSPGSQILPRVVQNVHYDNTRTARGVVLDSATFTNHGGFFALTDSATIEAGGSRAYFTTPVMTPVVPFGLNTFNGENLILTPAQFRSAANGSPIGVERTLDTQTVRVYYSSRTDAAALAAAPIIYNVAVSADQSNAALVDIDVTIGGSTDPGVETVLATYTQNAEAPSGSWTSVDLTADAFDSSNDAYHFVRHYTGTASAGPDGVGAVRLFIQAVGGNALVSRATNNGAFYSVEPAPTPTLSVPLKSSVLVLTSPAAAQYRSWPLMSATLTDAFGSPVGGRTVTFTLNGSTPTTASARTGAADGVATVRIRTDSVPGAYTVSAAFGGDTTYLGSADQRPITVTKASTAFSAASAVTYTESGIVATLSSGGRPLPLKPVVVQAAPAALLPDTDGLGRVRLNTLDLGPVPNATYSLGFAGDVLYAASPAFTVTLAPDDATVAGTPTGPQSRTAVSVAAVVTEVADGTPGDITRAKVRFELINSDTNASGGFAIGNVAANGSSRATILNAPAGTYRLNMTVVGGYYTSPTTSTDLAVYDTLTSATGIGWVMTTTASTGLPAGRKAVFGFFAKYLNGQTSPSGALEFNVEKATFNFLAAPRFEWLVVSGGRAELQGTGFVNRTGGYSFRLIATDAHPDTFELRIWNSSSSFAAPLYRVSGNLSGGNIVIR